MLFFLVIAEVPMRTEDAEWTNGSSSTKEVGHYGSVVYLNNVYDLDCNWKNHNKIEWPFGNGNWSFTNNRVKSDISGIFRSISENNQSLWRKVVVVASLIHIASTQHAFSFTAVLKPCFMRYLASYVGCVFGLFLRAALFYSFGGQLHEGRSRQ